jgi:cytochrome d ubiquinol oxidase subunit I
MHYPWWYVPFLTSPMLIAAVATFHVFVSMYAVGGGFFLAVETQHAYATRNRDYLSYLHDHAWFFILLTVVFGAITGVGIWWTIGLSSPLATQTLIHIFVFAWAMEYVTFVLEIVSAFAFYYSWQKLDPPTHVSIAWLYAVSGWLSLAIITAITAFMLNPGAWPAHPGFWSAIFNPQMIPQVLARTGGSFLLASLYVYLHATIFLKDPSLRSLIGSRSSRPGLLGALLVTLGGLWWYLALPNSAKAALVASSALNILVLAILAVTLVVFLMLYLGPYRNPGWLTPGFSLLLFSFGMVAIGAGEFTREAVRKPYVIYNLVLGNQLLAQEIPNDQTKGFLENGQWTKAYLAEEFPQVLSQGQVDDMKLLGLPNADKIRIGQVLFLYHCNDCHTLAGFSAVPPLLQGWTPEMIRALVLNPEKTRFFMPPWSGTPAEAELLSEYLISIAPTQPAGMNYDPSR